MHTVIVLIVCKMLRREYQYEYRYEISSKWRRTFLKSKSDHVTHLLQTFNGTRRSQVRPRTSQGAFGRPRGLTAEQGWPPSMGSLTATFSLPPSHPSGSHLHSLPMGLFSWQPSQFCTPEPGVPPVRSCSTVEGFHFCFYFLSRKSLELPLFFPLTSLGAL